MTSNINKKTILMIGFPWPYSYGGHRTTKLCRELSKNYNVICLTRPLFRYLNEINSEPFKIIQTKGLTTIYDPIRYVFTLISKFKNKNNKKLLHYLYKKRLLKVESNVQKKERIIQWLEKTQNPFLQGLKKLLGRKYLLKD